MADDNPSGAQVTSESKKPLINCGSFRMAIES